MVTRDVMHQYFVSILKVDGGVAVDLTMSARRALRFLTMNDHEGAAISLEVDGVLLLDADEIYRRLRHDSGKRD